MENKDNIDLLHKIIDSMSKQSDVLYKKIFILVALLGGLGTFLLKVEIQIYIKFSAIIVFFIVSIGLFSIYLKLSKLNTKIGKNIDKLERIENE